VTILRRVFPRTPLLPNFLRYPVLNGKDESFSVGELSDEDAAMLWDQWKAEWLKHVAKKRATAQETVKP